MRDELDEALCAKYPLIFRDRHAPMQVTAMCWGIGVGDGWYNIIDVLCGHLYNEYWSAKSRYEYIKDKLDQPTYGFKPDGDPVGKIITQELIDEAKVRMEEEAAKVPVAVQVKEKFGALRFYINAGSDEIFKKIHSYENQSYETCETCGEKGELRLVGWYKTLCNKHHEERKPNIQK